MHRLVGSDAGFLFIESETQTSTCVDLVVLGPPPQGRAPWSLADLRRHLSARLSRTPALRRRLAQVPLGIGHPLLVDDPEFDLDAHLSQVRLPAPGGDEQLNAAVADVLPTRLDQGRPLWRVVLVDGLAGDRQALVFAFHHALADGAGLANTLAQLIDDRMHAEHPAPRAAPAPAPRRAALFAGTLGRQLLAWCAFPLLVVRTLRRFRAVDRHRASQEIAPPPAMGGAPRTLLNRSADARRVYARTDLPLADVRRVRAAAGTTLSEVVLAVVAGALRGYLAQRDALPDTPLVVNVPIGNDAPGEVSRTTGNVFANYLAHLATDEPDPRRRLAAVAAANAAARTQLDVLGRDTLTAWLDRIPPALARPAAARMAAKQRSGEAEPDFNVLVSNMRLPGSPWTMAGRTVETVVMSGPAADGAGLNITLTGYADRLGLAIVANPSAIDAPEELADRLRASLGELLAAYTDPAAARPDVVA
ncbi:wax ester/triacylglycerol synthase family O-acyltransferase [Nocardioides houyundeii]|uniref:wax ester/triacylglycerol synthase family O-acyltransferase n=1 Tax=Nocardioides houyundeii TaxID=2045452 RepID=UPI000C7677C6|nr:wax ester/triacylglycerol synthase family O-acyltransferase [Nocardioides houyundeii]